MASGGLPSTIGKAVGKRVSRIRMELGLTQDQLVLQLRQHGLPWTRSNLTSLETGRRETVTLDEAILLSAALGVPVTGWFEGLGSEVVKVGPVEVWPLSRIRDALASGKSVRVPKTLGQRGPITRAAVTDVEANVARRLGQSPERVREAASRIWNRELIDEREERLQAYLRTTPPSSRAAIAARRGHITRELVRELAQTFE